MIHLSGSDTSVHPDSKLRALVNVSDCKAGGQPREHSWLPNEEGHATADTGSDQPSVPASILQVEWPGAMPRTPRQACNGIRMQFSLIRISRILRKFFIFVIKFFAKLRVWLVSACDSVCVCVCVCACVFVSVCVCACVSVTVYIYIIYDITKGSIINHSFLL